MEHTSSGRRKAMIECMLLAGCIVLAIVGGILFSDLDEGEGEDKK
jgi:hypothetical protein